MIAQNFEISSRFVFHIRCNRLKFQKGWRFEEIKETNLETWSSIEETFLWAYPSNRILGNAWKRGKNLREESLVSHYRESISREIITLWYLEARNFFFLAILLRPRFGRFNIILFHDLTWEITSTFIQDMSNNNIHTFMP